MEFTAKPRDLNSVETTTSENSKIIQKNERTMPGHEIGRKNMRAWLAKSAENTYLKNAEFQHTVRYHLGGEAQRVEADYAEFGALIPVELDKAVTENDYRFNNPRIERYDGIGDRVEQIVHHPDYTKAGDIIYGTGIVRKLAQPGGLKEGMGLYFLANHVGEAGHLCPVICNYETTRMLRLTEDFPGRDEYIEKLLIPSYSENYTSSQFLTEVQGGSDVGANDTRAWQDENGDWFIRGEKWFCSNANAELMLISARYDTSKKGTKGLSAFLIPATKPDGTPNNYTMRRLKEKMGTRALASAEIDYNDALAIPLGVVETGFLTMMERVIHHSRISLSVAVLGFTSRAYQYARDFALTREAFGNTVINYPLAQENLAHIKADMDVTLAGIFSLIALQDDIDTNVTTSADDIAFARLMSNISKSVTSKRAVDNVHHAIDGIGGNAAIENTSSMPRLFRDVVILENWEGTHNTLYMQVLRDMAKYKHDEAYMRVMKSRVAALSDDQADLKAIAVAHLATLEGEIEEYKGMEHGSQSLKIADIITKMANLFYFVEAVNEGDDQLKTDKSDVKLKAATLFSHIFIEKKGKCFDANYIQLCADIVKS